MKGTDSSYTGSISHEYRAAYTAAKINFAQEAAANIVDRVVKSHVIDEIADVVYYLDKPPIFAFPHPSFDDEDNVAGQRPLAKGPTNAVPPAYARYLAEVMGGDVNYSIIQSARVGATSLPRWMKFLCQAAYEGDVDQSRPYILCDDMISTGGTLAALRGYIIGNGGSVALTTTLASNAGVHEIFAIAEQTLGVLRSTYGVEIDTYWNGAFGHDVQHLTESEARYLLSFATEGAPGARAELLQRLRERIDSAASTGS